MSKEVWIGLISAVVLLGGLFGYQYWKRMPEAPELQSEPVSEANPSTEPQIQYPVPEAQKQPEQPPLPALPESDAPLRTELTALFAAAPIESLLIPRHLIQNFVATVNSLDGQIAPLRLRPVVQASGLPVVVTAADGSLILDAANARRYAPYITALKTLDAQAAAGLYQRYYPLFQQAYVELGFPGRYFNDRLISVIDHLLETPEVNDPIRLVRPKVLYEYEDPRLEQLSAGQKLLIRMRAENAAVVKAKLREFRAALIKASQTAPAAE